MQPVELHLKDNICFVCQRPIKTMAFKGTGVCGDNDRKVLENAKV